jgi:hypothetical protein
MPSQPYLHILPSYITFKFIAKTGLLNCIIFIAVLHNWSLGIYPRAIDDQAKKKKKNINSRRERGWPRQNTHTHMLHPILVLILPILPACWGEKNERKRCIQPNDGPVSERIHTRKVAGGWKGANERWKGRKSNHIK